MSDPIGPWRERVREAAATRTPLQLRGGGTKAFYGRTPRGEALDTRERAGIVSYEPTELVVIARAGTPLAEIEALLAQNSQMLAFEPPHFGAAATVGGCVAAGLAGPRRAAAGGVRDFVLGVKLLDGRGDVLSFGGQVMKNVAGYDVSRLITGSLGTLGLILEVSLKVLPRPLAEKTLSFELDEADAIARVNEWGGEPLPVSATAWHDGVLRVRLSGAEAAVRAAAARLGGGPIGAEAADTYWRELREQTADFFGEAGCAEPGTVLWRVSVPSSAASLKLPGAQLVEWGGALRWLRSASGAATVRARAAALGGHSTLFRGGDRDGEVFDALPPALMTIHRRLKHAFDPAGIFNPGRLYDGL